MVQESRTHRGRSVKHFGRRVPCAAPADVLVACVVLVIPPRIPCAQHHKDAPNADACKDRNGFGGESGGFPPFFPLASSESGALHLSARVSATRRTPRA